MRVGPERWLNPPGRPPLSSALVDTFRWNIPPPRPGNLEQPLLLPLPILLRLVLLGQLRAREVAQEFLKLPLVGAAKRSKISGTVETGCFRQWSSEVSAPTRDSIFAGVQSFSDAGTSIHGLPASRTLRPGVRWKRIESAKKPVTMQNSQP